MPLFAVIAAAIFLLNGLHVIDDTPDVSWLLIGLFFVALHFIVEPFWGAVSTRWRREP